MRLAVLWSTLTSYTVAFLRALADEQDCEIALVYQPARSNAPYRAFDLDFCRWAREDRAESRSATTASLQEFRPHCVLMTSWNFRFYMRLCLRLRSLGSYVVSTIDHQWEGRLKQRLGVLASPWMLGRRIDNFLVAGDRQAEFARRLGYPDVLYGLYAGETERYWCPRPVSDRGGGFLFVGRLVEEKGIRNLAAAYRGYRQRATHPWPLTVVGKGPLEHLLRDIEGVELAGFVQPAELPERMRRSRCLVLPSVWEPWGVVVHEAAAAHLPVIASYEVGAVTMFVRDGVNGRVVSAAAAPLAKAMEDVAGREPAELDRMGGRSGQLAALWSPRMLAAYFRERAGDRVPSRG